MFQAWFQFKALNGNSGNLILEYHARTGGSACQRGLRVLAPRCTLGQCQGVKGERSCTSVAGGQEQSGILGTKNSRQKTSCQC